MRQSQKKRIAWLLPGMILVLFCSCSMHADKTAQTAEAVAIAAVNPEKYFSFAQEDVYTDWRNESPVYAVLDGTSAQTSGSGMIVRDGQILIEKAGTYVLEGSFQGSVIVNADNALVRLVLNGVQIQALDGPAVCVRQADKVILSLELGKENMLSDSEAHSVEEDAAVYSKDDLVINGEGSLTINGSYLDGLKSKDDLKIVSGSLKINAKDDGLIGKDCIVIQTAQMEIEAGGDCIKSSNDSDAEKGYVAIQGGTYRLTAQNDGIQAETNLLICGGTFTILSGGGSSAAVTADRTQQSRPGQIAQQQTSQEESESRKALKAANLLQIDGGEFSIDSCDDALHSNNTILVRGGVYNIATGDDAVHADTFLHLTGGNLEIAKCYEGLESSQITIDDGTVRLTAQDDGINVAGGNDEGMGGPGQMDSFRSGTNVGSGLTINDGYLAVNASGDGIDINGSGEMNGGTLIVNGPANGGNSSLDYNGSFQVNGGVLIAAGSSGMAQSPSQESRQGVITMNYSAVQSAGTLFSLADESGTELLTFAPKKQYQSVIVSVPQLKVGTSYQYCAGGSSSAAQMDGVYTIGGYQKGNTVLAFSMESSAVYLNESGVTTQPNGGMGGRGGQPGGRQNKPDGEQNPDGMPPRDGNGHSMNRMPPGENGQQTQ